MPTVTVRDAVRYVRKLSYEFRDQKEKFYMFHQVLVDYRNNRINYASLVARIKEILKGHKKLILGFNHFIEKDYEITLHRAAPEEEEVKFMNKIKNRFQSDEPVYNSILEILKMYKEGLKDIGEVSSKRTSMNDALNFLNRAKDVFWNEREKYDMLIQILKDYKAERITSEVVAARVKELLKGHSSLILRFNAFLPKEHEIKLKDEPSQELVRLVDNIKERFKDDEHLYQSFLMSIKTYKEDKRKTTCDLHGELAVIFKDHQDLLKEFTRKFPNYDKVEENVVEDEKPTLSIPKWKQTYLGLVVISFIANVFHQPYNIICMKEYLIKRVSKILPIGDGWFVQKETFRCDLCHKFVQENVKNQIVNTVKIANYVMSYALLKREKATYPSL
ncbi:hypothetical protein PHAVU_004G023000, partial [Phaseolus vulgaris]